MARSFEDLTMEKGRVLPLTIPIERPKTTRVALPFAERRHVPAERTGAYHATKMLENAGHSAVIEHEGAYYLFYHIGWFRDGVYDHPRDTYVSQLRFKPDGAIYRISY